MNAEAVVKAMVVADGMGGLSGGKYYSEAAVNLWYQELLQTLMSDRFKGNPLDRQIEILQEFSEEIYSKLNQGLYKKGLDAGIKGGTTLSAVIHFWDTFIVSNCGDSPIYRIKNGTIELINRSRSKLRFRSKLIIFDTVKICRIHITTYSAEVHAGSEPKAFS